MTTKERGVVSDAPPTSRRHAAPIDAQRTAEELLFETFRLTHPILHSAREEHGSVPAPGTPRWWSAPDSVKVAGLLTLASEYLLNDPDKIAAEKLKAVAVVISKGEDWSAASRRPSHAELERRRAEPGPMATSTARAGLMPSFDPVAAKRWVRTGSSAEGVT